jgi:hypothetical protein
MKAQKTPPEVGGKKSRFAEIPQVIFEEFIGELKKANLPKEPIVRLEKTILKDGDLSHDSIKAALLSEE